MINWSDIPRVECYHPNVIRNKYTGELVDVPCGTCPACMLRKSTQYLSSIDAELKSKPNCVFVTLTYDNNNLPIYAVDNFNNYAIVRASDKRLIRYFSNKQNVIIKNALSRENVSKLDRKIYNKYGFIPTLCYDDVQLYLKRVRRCITKSYPSEKLTFFCCGEYGSRSFRPHYHLLLWFETQEALEYFKAENYKNKFWYRSRQEPSPLGYIFQEQVSTAAVKNYVSSYVSSASFVSSVLYKTQISRPFRRHSISVPLGYDYYCKHYNSLSSLASLTPIETQRGSSVSFSYPPSNIVNKFLLWPKGFDILSVRERNDFLEYLCIAVKNSVSRLDFVGRLVDKLISTHYTQSFHDYLCQISRSFSVRSWSSDLYRICRRINKVCLDFGIGIADYLAYVDEYFRNKVRLQFRRKYEQMEKNSRFFQNIGDFVLHSSLSYCRSHNIINRLDDFLKPYKLTIEKFGMQLIKTKSENDFIFNCLT